MPAKNTLGNASRDKVIVTVLPEKQLPKDEVAKVCSGMTVVVEFEFSAEVNCIVPSLNATEPPFTDSPLDSRRANSEFPGFCGKVDTITPVPMSAVPLIVNVELDEAMAKCGIERLKSASAMLRNLTPEKLSNRKAWSSGIEAETRFKFSAP